MSGIHNNFVQDLFKNPENARGFLETTLPVDLAAITDFSSLNYEDTSYIDPHLADYQTDLMFRFTTIYDTILVDIAKENLEKFRSFKYLYPSLTLLKYAKSGIIEPIEEALYDLFKDEKMIVNRRSLILYFIRTSGLKPEKLKEIILNPEVRKEIMTTAEMLIQEGIEKGIEKGREEGSYQKACQTARAMLKEGSLDYKKIASFTSLTLEDIERMAKQIRDL